VSRLRLDPEYARQFVSSNTYDVSPETALRMRCIDGNYANDPQLPAIAFPGGDLGDLAVIYASAQSFGFEADAGRCLEVLLEMIGGSQHFSLYESPNKILTEYLPFVAQLELDQSWEDSLLSQAQEMGNQGARIHVPPEYREESALIKVKSEFGLFPQYEVQTDSGQFRTSVYVYHQTLLDRRRKRLSEMLIQTGAVTLFEGCEEEYLFDALSETSDYVFFYALEDELRHIPLYSARISADDVEVDSE
jgi:hypothetical protein